MEKANERENKGKKKPSMKYHTGQQILIKNHRLSNAQDAEIKKLISVYEEPFVIAEVIGDNAVKVYIGRKYQIVNIAEVRPYQTDESKNA